MTARAALKLATKASHTAAEARFWRGDRFRSCADYARFLKAMRAVHCDLGEGAAHVIGPEAAAREATLIRRLDEDLRRLDADEEHAAAPTPIANDDFAWGVAYALNGSAIGAAVILKSGGAAADWPTGYLSAQAAFARAGVARRFFDALDAKDPEIGQATAGAAAVFAWIAAAGVDPTLAEPAA